MEKTKLLTAGDIHLIVLQNPVHLMTIVIFGLICGLCAGFEYASLVFSGITILFVLLYYIGKMLGNIWFWLIFIGCIIFPPIAPFVMIVMIVIRIRFLLEHKRAMAYGLLLYAIPIIINFNLTEMSGYGDYFDNNPYPHSMILYSFIFIGGAIVLHLLLVSLYKKGYQLKNAIILMLEFPVLIILLVIAVAGVFDGHLFDEPVNDHAPGDMHYTDAHHYSEPGTHQVEGYYRMGSHGEMQFVNGYTRTNPDGMLENNISYKG